MKRICTTLLIAGFLVFGLSAVAFAQQVTTELIGPVSGIVVVTIPTGPCAGQTDTLTISSGSVHLVASVDTSQSTVDYHINLLSVKGTGSIAQYIGNGAIDLLSQPLPLGSSTVVSFAANLFPTGPCRAGFAFNGALRLNVTVSFGTNFTLSSVSATTPS